jgi:hypothetical protein
VPSTGPFFAREKKLGAQLCPITTHLNRQPQPPAPSHPSPTLCLNIAPAVLSSPPCLSPLMTEQQSMMTMANTTMMRSNRIARYVSLAGVSTEWYVHLASALPSHNSIHFVCPRENSRSVIDFFSVYLCSQSLINTWLMILCLSSPSLVVPVQTGVTGLACHCWKWRTMLGASWTVGRGGLHAVLLGVQAVDERQPHQEAL